METIPEVEKVETEMSKEDKIAQLKKLAAEFSEDEIRDSLNLKTEQSEKEVPVIEAPKSAAIKLEPQIQMVADTLMSQAEEKVKSIYSDVDYSGILNANVDTLTKVSLMSSVIEPNARKMATIEKNLKSENAEGTQTETKKAEFSAPEKSGKVDNQAGEKLYSEMSAKLGFDEEESE